MTEPKKRKRKPKGESSIRLLTIEDWDIIEELVNTRKKFQNMGMSDELHTQMKEKYIKNRIVRNFVWFFGYFIGEELVAISSYHACNIPGTLIAGITWTKAGLSLPKQKGYTHIPACLVELRNYVIDKFKPAFFWSIGPVTSQWERLLPATILGDETLYEKIVYCEIKAGEKSGDPFVDTYVLVGATLGEDQLVFAFRDIAQTADPEGAPPRGDPSSLPDVEPPKPGVLKKKIVHPPKDMA